MQTSLFAVMVNWNLKDDTIACIHSLFATGIRRGQVIVVDSASEDGSVEALQAAFGEAVQIIVCEENVGFVGGINQGTKHALQQGAEWVFILNNDTVVEPAFMSTLEEFSQDHASYALLGPLIYYQDVPDRIWYFADHRWLGSLLTANRYKNRRDDGRLPVWERADYITGCAMLVRREVFERIGFLDPAMFMYGEDVDFCWRAGQAGFQVAAVSGAKMWHKVSASANMVLPKMRYFRIRNQIWFYRKHARIQLLPIFLFTILRAAWMGTGDSLRRDFELISPLMRGWRDGWFASMESPKNSR